MKFGDFFSSGVMNWRAESGHVGVSLNVCTEFRYVDLRTVISTLPHQRRSNVIKMTPGPKRFASAFQLFIFPIERIILEMTNMEGETCVSRGREASESDWLAWLYWNDVISRRVHVKGRKNYKALERGKWKANLSCKNVLRHSTWYCVWSASTTMIPDWVMWKTQTTSRDMLDKWVEITLLCKPAPHTVSHSTRPTSLPSMAWK